MSQSTLCNCFKVCTKSSLGGAELLTRSDQQRYFVPQKSTREGYTCFEYVYPWPRQTKLIVPRVTTACYSNSRNYKFSLPRPRIDIFKTSISFSGAFLWTVFLWQSDRVSHSAPSSKNFVHTLKQLHRMDFDRILLGRETYRLTVMFWSHCNDWSFETYFIHPKNCLWEWPPPPPTPLLFFIR